MRKFGKPDVFLDFGRNPVRNTAREAIGDENRCFAVQPSSAASSDNDSPPECHPARRPANPQMSPLRYENDGVRCCEFICRVSRHILGARPVTFLNAMRKRFPLA